MPPKNTQVVVERQLPHSAEAERAVLGAILLENKALGVAEDFLSPQDFFSLANRLIYESMVALRENNEAIDFVTLGEFMGREGKLDAAGGIAFITQIPDGLPRVSNTEHYAKIVREKSILRQMLHAAEAIENLALTSEVPCAKIVEQAIEIFSNLGQLGRDIQLMSRKEAAVSLLGQLERAEDSKILLGIPRIDEFIGGFKNGELIVFTAETGAGKSFLGLQTAHRACQNSQHGLYCSGEMKAAHLMGRELASASGVAHSKIRKPSRLSQEDFIALAHAAASECEQCEILDGELTLPNIRSKARAMGKEKIKFLIVDYDELVEVNGAKDEWDSQRRLVRALKSLGMELNIPVFLVSQLRKSLDKADRKHPTLQRVYGSSSKIKHSSIVIYIDRPFVVEMKGDETDAKIYVLKNRDGRLGMTDAKFNIRTFRFDQWDESEEPIVSRKIKKGEEADV